MSIDGFVADPAGYSKGHVVQFSHLGVAPAQAGMQLVSAMNNWGGAWTAEKYEMIPGQYTRFSFNESGLGRFINGVWTVAPDRIGKGSRAMHTVNVNQGPVDLGIRFLPWNADCVTYMKLDPAARTFFTGPINGCSIYLGTVGADWWAFHANRNNAGAHNAGMKASMTDEVNIRLPVPVRIRHGVVYQTDYHDFGFVCGRFKDNKWRFYVVDTNVDAVHANKWHQTVRSVR